MPPDESATMLMQVLFLPRTAGQTKIAVVFTLHRLCQSPDCALQIFHLRDRLTSVSKNR